MTKPKSRPGSRAHTAPTRQPRSRGTERRQAAVKRMAWRWPAIGIGTVLFGIIVLSIYLAWSRPAVQPVSGSLVASSAPAEGAAHSALGPANAPVTIAEYADFGCPSCQAWHRAGILNQIRAQYGDKVRFVWYDFPVITPQSPKAAEAARCAADQGKFWDYHDLLYLHAPAIDITSLKSYASELKLDSASFTQCLDSGAHQAAVDQDLQDAFAHQFRGTPSFLINGQPLIGPPALAVLQQRIDAILAGK